MRAHHLVALLREQARGDRRVDPAGHRDQHGGLMRPRLPRGPAPSRPRIVTSVIEARFDDLTGAEPSFRLVEPGRRARGHAAPTRSPASSPRPKRRRQRGLWVGGLRRLRGRARPGPRARASAAASAGDPFAAAAARLVRDVRGPGGDASCPSRRRTRRRIRRRVGSRPSTGRLRRAPSADPRAHRGRRHLPGEPHAAAAAPRSTATTAGCTGTCASRSGAPTPATSTWAGTACCRPPRSCSSGSTAMPRRPGR